ncbi:MAG TPA: hypothetical protein PKE49_03245 [Leptospiraceae bacterium]|nr:hypothetical protein [Leptospirales bacterium]HMU82903.1 hypothetical protein [Leptospiraceae bacterium]HMW58910.1 hypothetical protein [Leptospiraceae bacterium]HMX55511.1 hypothetical protein [Leptospiraceae bacterium]HMZ37297.1 hypothetical protein [Leptospiraceae bacterium]
MLWLRLGDNELVQLDHVVSIKKQEPQAIELTFLEPNGKRILTFPDPAERNRAFDRLLENLVKLRMALE